MRAAKDVGATAYAGTPDYLKVILDAADAAGVTLKITRAAVGGGALFPSLRAEYADRGVACLQCYATADLGNIAYESEAMEGMIVDEGVIVEIVRPGTGDPVPEGDVGEVVVTTLNPDYPLIRFATGDLSAILPGQSPCGRTNMRIKGWMGRADQTTKIKGMFVRPEQVAEFVARHDEVAKARVIATREGEKDVMTVQVEAPGADREVLAESVAAVLKLRGAGGNRGARDPAQRRQGDRRPAELRDHVKTPLLPADARRGGRVVAGGVGLDPGLGGEKFVRRGETVPIAVHPTEGDPVKARVLHIDRDPAAAACHVPHERHEFLKG